MSKRLENIESRLQKIIEGAGKLFSTAGPTESFSAQIVRCMRENAHPDASGILTAPIRYLVEVNPSNSADRVFDQADLEKIIADLSVAASESGIVAARKPEIIIRANPKLSSGSIRVSASYPVSKSGSTASVNILDEPESTSILPEGAFLIVDGARVVQLSKPVINIGRRSSNDIVLDDQRVSRNHAQLRSIKGIFVVFDLNSRGGTFVNNVPVSQKELFPGDVISLGGIPLIYSQETGGVVFDPLEQTPTNQLLASKDKGEKNK